MSPIIPVRSILQTTETIEATHSRNTTTGRWSYEMRPAGGLLLMTGIMGLMLLPGSTTATGPLHNKSRVFVLKDFGRTRVN